MVDLTKTDTYDNYTAPDPDVEVAMKVIRTARDACLHPAHFNAAGAMLLSEVHSWFYQTIESIQGDSDLPVDTTADSAQFDTAGQDSDPTEPGLFLDNDAPIGSFDTKYSNGGY